MALCPECGGKVSSIQMISLRPGNGVVCRWCRSELRVSRRTRLFLNLALIGAGAGAVSWLGARFVDTGDPLHLVLLAGCLLGLGVVILMVEGFCELETRVPRDHRDWEASEKSRGSDPTTWNNI